MNAVQYQCSLGYNPDSFRDLAFTAYWEEQGKVEFQERLLALYTDGDLVANCCTMGNTTTNANALYDLVEAAVHAEDGLHHAATIAKAHPIRGIEPTGAMPYGRTPGGAYR